MASSAAQVVTLFVGESQVQMRIGAVGCQQSGAAQAGDGALEFVLLEEHAAEIEMGGRIARIQLERSAERHRRFLQAGQLKQHRTQIDVGIDPVRCQANRVAVGFDRLFERFRPPVATQPEFEPFLGAARSQHAKIVRMRTGSEIHQELPGERFDGLVIRRWRHDHHRASVRRQP